MSSMQRKGRKIVVRIWPEAHAVLRLLREQFRPIDRYGKNEHMKNHPLKLGGASRLVRDGYFGLQELI